jgi:hypothetical protein
LQDLNTLPYACVQIFENKTGTYNVVGSKKGEHMNQQHLLPVPASQLFAINK